MKWMKKQILPLLTMTSELCFGMSDMLSGSTSLEKNLQRYILSFHTALPLQPRLTVQEAVQILEPYFPRMYESPPADAAGGVKAFLLRKMGVVRMSGRKRYKKRRESSV